MEELLKSFSSIICHSCSVGRISTEAMDSGATCCAGESQSIHKRSLYEHNGVAVCSQKRALIIACGVFAVLFIVSVVLATAGPQTDCPCLGVKPADIDEEDMQLPPSPKIPIATNNELFPWNNPRLPTFIRPMRYKINIHPNLTTLDVKGQVTIDFQVEKETNFIVFHSKNLTLTEKHLISNALPTSLDRKGHRLPITRFLEYPSGQQVYMELKEKLRKKVNYTLVVRFNSRLGRDLEGFYLSSYVNKQGETKFLATTHFEPTYARSAFPCFDEPHLKARFRMSIFRDRFHIALFNTPIANTEDAGFYMGTGLLRDDFEESVEMSTYLVAFVICDYKSIMQHTSKNITVSVYAPTGLLPQAHFALSIATQMMDHYEDYFGVPYPLPKQDLIAIPDFAAGAMENWGLITYRETSILYDPDETSSAAKQWVAIVVAHELAHQWFGNLVTMKWWNDLWLNEGFASFLEYLGVDHVMPDWRMMEQFILDKTQPALSLDALATSHPISVQVGDPTEIESIFDTISYNKGASILYMLEKFLHEEIMRSGLNDYLNMHMYSNAETKDLWDVFSKHANQSLEVKVIMDSWTNQMGFPLINLTREGDKIIATQERFLLTDIMNHDLNITNSTSKETSSAKWYVPLSYYTDKEKEAQYVWMNQTNVEFNIPENIVWLKANVNQSGFYRVTYSEDMWMSIIAALHKNHSIFSAADRASLIDDVFTLCRAGILNATVPLELSLYLLKERDYVPWATALEHFQSWARRLAESSSYRMFLEYTKRLITPVSESIGWEDTGPHLKKLMRSDILASAILANVDSAVNEAKPKFRAWMEKSTRIPPNLREVVYAAGIKYGGVKEWEFCWDKYNKSRVPSEKKLLLKVLGVASDPWLLQRYLQNTLNRDLIKPQDIKIVLAVVAANPEGRLLSWRHLRAHWNHFQDTFGNNTFTMGGLVTAVTSHFAAEYDHKEVSHFFRRMDMGSGQRALEQSLETIMLNIHWVKHNDEPIFSWLKNYLR